MGRLPWVLAMLLMLVVVSVKYARCRRCESNGGRLVDGQCMRVEPIDAKEKR